MLAINNTTTQIDDFDAFLENPLGFQFTIHQSKTLAKIVKELHCDSEGYIASAQLVDGKMKQKFYKIDDFDCETENAFFSMNTFISPWRNKNLTYELTSFFCDLDCYRTLPNHTFEQIIWFLENDIFGILLPYPTWLVCSGNGLYYILKFDNKIKVRDEKLINFQIKEKWDICMQYIRDTLDDFGADTKAMDCSRVLRIDGTFNTKKNNRKKVEVIREYGNTIEDIDEFWELWLPDSYYPQEKPKKTPKPLLNTDYTEERVELPEGIKTKRKGTKSLKKLNAERMGDIVRLVGMRHGNCTGMRNYFLLIYTYHCLLYTNGDLERATEEIYKLNNQFSEKENESQIKATIKTAYSAYEKWKTGEKHLYQGEWCRAGYNFTNQKLIQIFEITEEEQRKLKTIKSKKIRDEKRNAKKRAKRRNEDGLTKREQQKQETIAKVMQLKSQGLNNSEIARQLGISRQIVSKYVNQK